MTLSYDLLKSCNPVSGSLQTIAIILPEDVQTYGRTLQLAPVATMPTLKVGTRAFVVQADVNTAYFKERKQPSVHGDFYNVAVGFSLRRLRTSIDAVRTLLMNRRVHLLITDNGGKVRFLPWVKLSTDEANTDNRRAGFNGYKFEFTTQLKMPTATIPEISREDNVVGDSNTGGGNTGGGGSVPPQTFRIVPLAELEDGIVVRLRVPTTQGDYLEIGTLLGTLARYVRQVGEDAEWRNKLGFSRLGDMGDKGVSLELDSNLDPIVRDWQ